MDSMSKSFTITIDINMTVTLWITAIGTIILAVVGIAVLFNPELVKKSTW